MTSLRETTILVVDDEEDTAALLCELLQRRGYRAVALSSGSRCLEYLRSGVADVVVTDVLMPGMTGIELCRELHLRHPDLRAVVLTGVAEPQNAIDAIRAGAYDFITKPAKSDLLEISIKRALEDLAVRREVNRLRLAPAIAVEGIFGTSPAIRATIELIRRAAASDATVLVTGESGTGKELVARALHQSSSRANAPFVALNCGAVPAPLLESELFGHVRGAFTDAKRSRAGLFVQAGEGTLFLDEIGEMPLDMQVKLLRALQERKVRPIGADEEQPFACRIVAATNRDLEQEIASKRFREDLFYRINVVVVPVPPLRERGEDIIELARLFLARAAEAAGLQPRSNDDIMAAVHAKRASDAPDERMTLGDLLYADRSGTSIPEDDWVRLVESIAAGDQQALRALYERTHRLVFTLAMRICSKREIAEEITLDVFHDVWRRSIQYDPQDGSVVGWIMNQARSRAIDRLRFEQRKKRVDPHLGHREEQVEVSGPADIIDARQRRGLLQEALTALTPDERHAIETSFFSELTYSETALRLDQPLGTVKTRVRSALAKLRKALKNEGGPA